MFQKQGSRIVIIGAPRVVETIWFWCCLKHFDRWVVESLTFRLRDFGGGCVVKYKVDHFKLVLQLTVIKYIHIVVYPSHELLHLPKWKIIHWKTTSNSSLLPLPLASTVSVSVNLTVLGISVSGVIQYLPFVTDFRVGLYALVEGVHCLPWHGCVCACSTSPTQLQGFFSFGSKTNF